MLIRVLALSLAVAALRQEPQPRESDFDWVQRHIYAARDVVMPMGTQSQAAAYRSSGDQWVDWKESYFSIDRSYPDPTAPNREALIATVTSPVGNALSGTLFGGTLRSQLLELHHGDSNAPLETLLLRLSIRRTKLTATQCPAITNRINSLPGMAITLPDPGGSASRNQTRVVRPPALHPVMHHVIVSIPEAHINANFSDPSVSVVGWALQTLDDLNKCITP